MATKKSTPRKKSSPKSKKRASNMVSFRRTSADTPFLTLRFTKQTVYWLVICAMAIVFTLWILKLQGDIESIYDSIDSNSTTLNTETVEKKKN